MNASESPIRHEELSAGRALGDLSHEEARELFLLENDLAASHDFALDLIVGGLSAHFLKDVLETPPAAVISRLHQYATVSEGALASRPLAREKIITFPSFLRSPLLGWAAAAALLIFTVSQFQSTAEPSPIQALSALRQEATGLFERPFQATAAYPKSSGQVTWSDAKQQGYMTLSGLPPNDPAIAQYQLWIVDPKRDEAPIDGGVFNIPAASSPVIVPIVAKLALSHPQAFVITLEQPGGVVKSKQEFVVALAKN